MRPEEVDRELGVLSPGAAVFVGHLVISGGVLAIMAIVIMVAMSVFPGAPFWLVIAVAALVSWPWWSATVPPWFRWAVSRGVDPYRLQEAGEAWMLLYPRDTFLARTEFGDRWKAIDEAARNPLMDIRESLLQGSIAPPRDGDLPVWGVVTEFGLKGGSATLVALEDGTCSLYTSTGGGVIGAGEHAAVQEAVRALIGRAGAAESELERVDDLSLPAPGEVSIYVLVSEGMVGLRGPEAQLRDEPPGKALYEAAQNVITQVRLHTPGA